LRSTFRHWAAERTGFPPEIIEMALAHTVAGATEGALLSQRRDREAAGAG